MIQSYKDLIAWKKARILVKAIYEATNEFPPEEKFGLTSQIRRAAISIPSNIAEGRARSSKKDFRNFVIIAIGSLAELETQIILANDLNYITEQPLKLLESRINELQKILYGLKNSLEPKS